MDNKSNIKKAFPVLMGNMLEAYDFCLYGLLAVYFSKVFFLSHNTRLLWPFYFSVWLI